MARCQSCHERAAGLQLAVERFPSWLLTYPCHLPAGAGSLTALRSIWLMWTRCKVCDACHTAPATVETGAGFFLCDDCEAVVVVAFQEFELPDLLPIED